MYKLPDKLIDILISGDIKISEDDESAYVELSFFSPKGQDCRLSIEKGNNIECFCNNIYDFNGEVITHIGQINSAESEILQLADLLNGALAYQNRNLESEGMANQGKIEFVNALQKKRNIDKSTARYESKFNLFIWEPRK